MFLIERGFRNRSLIFITAILLTLAMTPFAAAPANADTGPAAISPGAAVLSAGCNTENAAAVWYGKDNNNGPGKWRITGEGDDNSLTLLAAGIMGKTEFGFESGNAEYTQCFLGNRMDDIRDGLTKYEKQAIKTKNLKGSFDYNGENTDAISIGSDIDTSDNGIAMYDQYMWPLTAKEAFAVHQSLRAVSDGEWWLGSPGENVNGFRTASAIDKNGAFISSAGEDAEYGVRPAFYLDKSKVLFASKAAGGKASESLGAGALASVGTNASGEWKLTLKGGHDSFNISLCNASYNHNTKKVTISYDGAVQEENGYISAVIKDSAGNIKYYGRIARADQPAGTAAININGKMTGTDKLFVFNEQCNGDKKTDYASSMTEIPFELDKDRTDTHDLEKHDKVWPAFDGEGKVCEGTEEYWECSKCHWLYSDAAGEHLISSPVSIPLLGISKTELDFGKQGEDYAAPAARTITVTNNTNGKLTLDQPTSSYYVTGALSKKNLDPAESATFTVSPKAGLKHREYFEKLKMQYHDSAGNTASKNISLRFIVRAELDLISGFDATNGTGSFEGYGYRNVVDGDKDTKWANDKYYWEGGIFSGMTFVEFSTEAPVIPKSCILTTANDAEDHPGRNPGDWKLFGKNDGDNDWTLLREVKDDDVIKGENSKGYEYFLSNDDDKEYKFFRFEVHEVQDEDMDFQLAEVELLAVPERERSLEVSANELDFGEAFEGYAVPEEKTVRLTNKGSRSLSFKQPSSDSFVISHLSSATLAPGETATFTVAPKASLAAGNHNEELKIYFSDNKYSNKKVSLKFKVKYDTETLTGFRVTGGTGGFGGQEKEKLFDGTTTSWHNSVTEHWENGRCYVDFETEDPRVPVGYSLQKPVKPAVGVSYAPCGWTLYGRDSLDDEWTVLSKVKDDNTINDYWDSNFNYVLDISNPKKETYKYYRFEGTQLPDGDRFILAELRLIVVKNPVRKIEVSPQTLDFGTLTEGYELPESKDVTVKNIGTGIIDLIQPSASDYRIGDLSKKKLQAGETATFSVVPDTDLAAGGHNEELEIHYKDGGKRKTKVVKLSFSVQYNRNLKSGFTVIGGTGGNEGHGADMLLDADKQTKWCFSGCCNGNNAVIEFESDEPVIPRSYVLTTGDYCHGQGPGGSLGNRNLRNWNLYGRVSKEDGWTLLNSVPHNSEQENTLLKGQNSTSYEFSLSNDNEVAYKYYLFEVTKTWDYWGAEAELAELELYALNTNTITFDPNGGTMEEQSAKTGNGRKLSRLPEPTYEGMNFKGWFTEKTGGRKVTVDTAYVKDMTLYAHWEDVNAPDPNEGGGTNGGDDPGTNGGTNGGDDPGTNGGTNGGKEESKEKKPASPVKVKLPNPLRVKGKNVVIKYAKLKKKAKVVGRGSLIMVSNAKGKVTYKKVMVGSKKINKKYGKKFIVDKRTGNLKVKKGIRKGTYKLKIKVTAAGDKKYKSLTRTVIATVKVR